MTITYAPSSTATKDSASVALRAARTFWLISTAVGLWAFVYFIVAFFYARTFSGDFAAWNDKPLIDGHVPGDRVGNLAFATHVLLAAVMTLSGTLQLIPPLRTRWPGLHRATGRVFLLTAALLGLGGLYLVWVRGTYLSLIAAVAVSLDGVLILVFASRTILTAIRRDFAAHRRWALRTFMAASGVWMLRVGYMFWAIATRGWGMTRNMDGPFDVFWVFGAYLLPLLVLEVYLRVEPSAGARPKLAVAALIGLLTVAMGVGIVGAGALMWGPYL